MSYFLLLRCCTTDVLYGVIRSFLLKRPFFSADLPRVSDAHLSLVIVVAHSLSYLYSLVCMVNAVV